jgi:hypothetical protein
MQLQPFSPERGRDSTRCLSWTEGVPETCNDNSSCRPSPVMNDLTAGLIAVGVDASGAAQA